MADKLKLILTEDEMNRFFGRNGRYYIDVHNLKVIEAKKLIKKIGSLMAAEEKLTVIHGYNKGTAIKEMLINNKLFYRNYILNSVHRNPGRTEIIFLV